MSGRSAALRFLLFAFLLSLSACAVGQVDPEAGKDIVQKRREAEGAVTGGGLFSFGSDGTIGGSGIAVNSFLWRASLDTISFFPLSQADPFGGVIITDWYTPPNTPNSRFKLNVFILGRELRADGLRVSAFKQVMTGSGQWIDAAVAGDTIASLENAILARARELRIVASTLQ